MPEATRPYDTADYLRDEADIAAYLKAAAEDGDPATMAVALGAVARARNMAQLARQTGVSREGLYKALAPGGNPSFATVARVASVLGYPITFGKPESTAPAVTGPAEAERAQALPSLHGDEGRPARTRRRAAKAAGPAAS